MIQDVPPGIGLESTKYPMKECLLSPTTESVVHFLAECPMYSLVRWELFGKDKLREEYLGNIKENGNAIRVLSNPTPWGDGQGSESSFTKTSPVPWVEDPLISSPASLLFSEEVLPASPEIGYLDPLSPTIYVKCSGSPSTSQTTGRSGDFGGSGDSTSRATRVGRGAKHKSAGLNRRPQQDNEIFEHFFYGSDEEIEHDDEQEEGTLPVLIPRTARIFFDDNEAESAPPKPSFAWSPAFSTPSTTPEVLTIPLQGQLAVGPSTAPDSMSSHSIDKFDFQWRAFPQPQIDPDLRREPFSDIDCGPTASYATPYDAFIAIWDRQFMEHIAVETNRYAQQLAAIMLKLGTMRPGSRITQWYDTTVDELYVYFAVVQTIGIVVKSRIDEYWNHTRDIFSTPEFTTAMKFNRFLLLTRCLHFQNNDGCDPASMTRAQAKLFKLQPLLDHLNYKFSHLYNMRQNVSLDESLTMWKGWLEINQFIKNKTATVGIKTFELCESQTGYLWRFEVHAGHVDSSNLEDDGPLSGIIPALVLRLLHGLEHKGHTVFMDNFYNSPALARELKCRGFDCVGTLRTNRQFVPVELTTLTEQMATGQVSGCTSGDVDLLVWRDNNLVALISTYHGLATVNCGDTPKPTIIHDYNICMGGVDRKDQMIAMYPIERKRMTVWYKKFFRRLLNVSILNAYILYKSETSIEHRSFRKTLVNQLLSRHSQPSPAPITLTECTTRGFEHYPLQYVVNENDKRHNRYKRSCAECGKRVVTYCKECNKALCAFTCFGPYHNKNLTVTLRSNANDRHGF